MRSTRARLEGERREAIKKLQQVRGSSEVTTAETGGVEDTVEGGDRAQASLLQHLEVATCERLASRISRLTEALHRIEEATYGGCERCVDEISPKRLRAVPETTTCIAGQEAFERRGGRRALAA